MKAVTITSAAIAILAAFLPIAKAAPASTPAASALYDEVYPIYAEFCAATRIEKRPGFGLPVKGGIGGHGVIYLQGACRDKSSPYPRIQVCRDFDRTAGMTGVGVSVNSDFVNVNWIATESKSFFLNGDVPENEPLSRQAYLKARQRAVEMQLLKGVKFHPELLQKKPPGMSDEEYMLEETIGTDYAINFGRSLYCARIPISDEMLGSMVKYLNSLNEKYYHSGTPYNWSGISDNCTHTTRNALAAADVWKQALTNRFILRQLFNIAAPSNNFVELARRGNDLPLDDPMAIYRDPIARKAVLENHWLPTQHGVLIERVPIHHDNQVFKEFSQIEFLAVPGISPYRARFKKMMTESRYHDLRTNLLWFIERYQHALDSRRPVDELVAFEANVNPGIDEKDFEAFYQSYYVTLANQLDDATMKLALLGIE
ncbi:MAG: hypothetical protein A2428_17290 [Bdellovibrionales bacterium RIFOXYC1_FULL_54_43]|nr:MAG: hypothetical protein A2428_17290 [Bdellovibrionales bacterium RIFOXYC1_FULL_54_43]